jgi:hypothetical protein
LSVQSFKVELQSQSTLSRNKRPPRQIGVISVLRDCGPAESIVEADGSHVHVLPNIIGAREAVAYEAKESILSFCRPRQKSPPVRSDWKIFVLKSAQQDRPKANFPWKRPGYSRDGRLCA